MKLKTDGDIFLHYKDNGENKKTTADDEVSSTIEFNEMVIGNELIDSNLI